MQIELLYRPSYTLARVVLNAGEALRAEPGAMVGMNGVQVETKMQGGFLRSLARSAFGGESLFINTYRANQPGAEVLLAPTLPGDVLNLPLAGDALLVQSGSFLGCGEKIEVDTRWSGARTFFGGEGLIMLRCSGEGELILSSYGAIHELTLAEDQSYTVDTGHLVAFSEKIGFEIRTVGGVKSTLLGGEGLVIDLRGPGRVLLQTRSEGAFLDWLLPKLPKPGGKSE